MPVNGWIDLAGAAKRANRASNKTKVPPGGFVEKNIARRLADGESVKSVAAAMSLSEDTIRKVKRRTQ